ncbi:MAG TPA: hypothetical protein VFN30_12490 [Chitinophagaceae bacterium]|nr:hypothetical protein [Chitinophagaceae bacterium]
MKVKSENADMDKEVKLFIIVFFTIMLLLSFFITVQVMEGIV